MLANSPVSPVTEIDLALTGVIAVLLPLYGFFQHRRDQARQAAGQVWPLISHYRQSLAILWALTALVFVSWIASKRPLAELGLSSDVSWPFFAGLTFAVAASAIYGAQLLTLRRSPRARAQLANLLKAQQGVRDVLPNTPQELRAFRVLAPSAGFTEEVLFRGFLIWSFAHWMHPWMAATCALAIFTLAHLYQETKRALLGVLMAGATMTALVLVSGSLWPAMLLHAVVDLVGGEMAWLARKEIAASAQAPPT